MNGVTGLIIGVVLGVILTVVFFLLKKNKLSPAVAQKIADLENSLAQTRSEWIELDKQKGMNEVRLENSESMVAQQSEELLVLKTENKDKAEEISIANTNLLNMEDKLHTQKNEMQELQKKFTTEFENIANKILEEKSVKFTSQNKENIESVLNPLSEKLKSFEDKVQSTYEKQLKERTELKEQVIQLSSLNQTLSNDAQNLTRALTHDNKTQGNWGEMILEKILSESGLNEGEEYQKQFSTKNEEGNRIQPDYVIQLPDNKHIVIDSKVSLVAYNHYVNPKNEEDKQSQLKSHLLSVRSHIKLLSEKNYHTGDKLDTPDFVLLFMPIEPAFSVALQQDKELYEYAWSRNIVIVSPTTLLATIKTIASIWNQEKQNRNTLEIARQAGALYDKFVGFLEDMEKMEKGITQVDSAYKQAMNKLKSGNGNLIKRSENIRELGAKTNKQIPEKYIEN